jgi:hypothetical protein
MEVAQLEASCTLTPCHPISEPLPHSTESSQALIGPWLDSTQAGRGGQMDTMGRTPWETQTGKGITAIIFLLAGVFFFFFFFFCGTGV